MIMMLDKDTENFLTIQRQQLKVFIDKNRDYGDSYKDYGVVGILIRSMDKINRLKQVSKTSVDLGVPTETLRDTLLDLSIYSVLGLMELERLNDDIHN
jgi:hypothetical protein